MTILVAVTLVAVVLCVGTVTAQSTATHHARQAMLLAHQQAALAESQAAKWRLRALADPLTTVLAQHGGLLNHAGLEEAWDAASRDGRPPSWLITLDIDHFKVINDTYGHPTGDRVLATIADRINDVTWFTAARVGGDELVLLVSTGAPIECLITWLDARLRRPVDLDGGVTVPVSTSIGWTRVESTDRLIDARSRADHAMYQAKRVGQPVRRDIVERNEKC